eukprot:403375084
MENRRNNRVEVLRDSPQTSQGNSPQVFFDEEPYGLPQHQQQNYINRVIPQSNSQQKFEFYERDGGDDELQDELMNRRQGQSSQSKIRGQLPDNQVQQRIQKLFNDTKNIQQKIQQDQNINQNDRNRQQQVYSDESQEYYESNDLNQNNRSEDEDPDYSQNQLQRDNSKFIETQLHRVKENNVLLSRRFEQAQEEIEKSHDQIARQAQHNHNLKLQNEKLQQELEEIVLEHQNLMQRQSEDAISYERRIEHLNQELLQQKKMHSMKEDNMRQLQVANDQYKDKSFKLENEISDRIEEIDRLKAEARKKEELLDQFFLNRGAETAFKIEMEQLREDNKRLMKLLKQTKEYQDFANFVEDSGGHVRNVDKEMLQQTYEQNLPVDDENWVPQEAYQLAHKFRDFNGNDLTPNLVNQLLQDLNKIWREREKKQIYRIKQQTQNEIMQLKRQLNHRTPFDELTAKKNISRLQKKLQNARIELGKTQSIKDKQKQMPIGVDLVDNTLQIITSMQQQRKVLEQENTDLKDRIKKLELIRGNQEYDKAKYMEGAVWMGKRVSNEIEKVCQSIESLIQEYTQRTSGLGGLNSSNQSAAGMNSFGIKQQQQDIQTLQRAQVWFLEAVKTCTFEMYEQTINMLESAVYHMEEAQTKLGGANLMESVQRDFNNLNIQQQIPIESQTKNSSINYVGKATNGGYGRISEKYSEYSQYEKSRQSSEGDVESMFRATARFQQ